jgi:hypothetical protein
MATATKADPMAKKKHQDTPGPPTAAVKIDRALAGKARLIATDKGIDMAEYLSESLRAVIERDWAKMIRRVGGEGEVK